MSIPEPVSTVTVEEMPEIIEKSLPNDRYWHQIGIKGKTEVKNALKSSGK